MVLDPIGASLKTMVKDSGRFVLYQIDDTDTYSLQFSTADHNDREPICNALTRVFCVGDLKFYLQMLGRDNMHGSWCMWCSLLPSDWKLGATSSTSDSWMLPRLKVRVLQLKEGILNTCTQIRGIVDFAIRDFIDVINFVYPVLHGEIGLVDAATDCFYDVLDDKIEVMSNDEKKARTKVILKEVKVDEGKLAQIE